MFEVCQFDHKGRFHKVLLTKKQILWLANDVEHTPYARGHRKLFLFDRASQPDGASSTCKTNRPDSSVSRASDEAGPSAPQAQSVEEPPLYPLYPALLEVLKDWRD